MDGEFGHDYGRLLVAEKFDKDGDLFFSVGEEDAYLSADDVRGLIAYLREIVTNADS